MRGRGVIWGDVARIVVQMRKHEFGNLATLLHSLGFMRYDIEQLLHVFPLPLLVLFTMCQIQYVLVSLYLTGGCCSSSSSSSSGLPRDNFSSCCALV